MQIKKIVITKTTKTKKCQQNKQTKKDQKTPHDTKPITSQRISNCQTVFLVKA